MEEPTCCLGPDTENGMLNDNSSGRSNIDAAA
jgi:hypothetical protein